jgi:ATP synthase protein I
MEERSLLKQFLRASTVGLNLVLATFVGLAIGYYLDKWLGTSPWLTIIFLIVGIIAGFRELWRVAKDEERDSDDKKTL